MLHAVSRQTKNAGSRGSLRPVSAPPAERLSGRHTPLEAIQSAYGNQAMLHLLQSRSTAAGPAGVVQRTCSCGGEGPEYAECKKKKHEDNGLQRKAATGCKNVMHVPPVVHEALRSPGQPLDAGMRHFMELRFGYDFSDVRIHTGAKAAASAEAVHAQAYTVGRNIVFGRNGYGTGATSRHLLAHELAHVVQQRGNRNAQAQTIGPENDSHEREAESVARHIEGGHAASVPAQSTGALSLQRTPAKKVSCAPGPLHLPGGGVIPDPVAVITAAENGANRLLDQTIAELDATRRRILGGAAIGWPAISDALGFGLRLMGLDPNSARVWKDSGVGTAALLLRRLRAIRGTIGSGSFFFTCLGPPSGTIGVCSGDLCKNANAVSCAGSFRTDFCEGFWTESAAFQAGTVLHESAHNFAFFIQDPVRRGQGTAECYARFAQVVGGTDIQGQRTDLCPDPPP